MTAFNTEEIRVDAPFCRREDPEAKNQSSPNQPGVSPTNCFKNEILNKIDLDDLSDFLPNDEASANKILSKMYTESRLMENTEQKKKKLLSEQSKSSMFKEKKITPRESFLKLKLPLEIQVFGESEVANSNKVADFRAKWPVRDSFRNGISRPRASKTLKSTITKSINISCASVLAKTDRSTLIHRKKKQLRLRSRTSLEKFPPAQIIESLSQRHSVRLYESRIMGKDSLGISIRIDRQLSLDQETEQEEKSMMGSFLYRKEKKKEVANDIDQEISNANRSSQVRKEYEFSKEYSSQLKPRPSMVQKQRKLASLNVAVEETNSGGPNMKMVTSFSSHKELIDNIKISNFPLEITDNSKEINVKISVLNIITSDKSPSKMSNNLGRISFKEKIFEEVKESQERSARKASEVDRLQLLQGVQQSKTDEFLIRTDQAKDNAHPMDSCSDVFDELEVRDFTPRRDHLQDIYMKEYVADIIEDCLMEDALNCDLFANALRIKFSKENLDNFGPMKKYEAIICTKINSGSSGKKRIPKLDIGSLDEKDVLKLKSIKPSLFSREAEFTSDSNLTTVNRDHESSRPGRAWSKFREDHQKEEGLVYGDVELIRGRPVLQDSLQLEKFGNGPQIDRECPNNPKVNQELEVQDITSLNQYVNSGLVRLKEEDQPVDPREADWLQMMKENSNHEKLITKEEKEIDSKSDLRKDDNEEIVYAIRTNIETIVEYSELLVKIIQEEFAEEVLTKINNLKWNPNLVLECLDKENHREGWTKDLLARMGLETHTIKEIRVNFNKFDVDSIKNTSNRIVSNSDKENLAGQQNYGLGNKDSSKEGNVIDKIDIEDHISQTSKTKSGEKPKTAFLKINIDEQTSNSNMRQAGKTISNIDNFCTLRDISSEEFSPNQKNSNFPKLIEKKSNSSTPCIEEDFGPKSFLKEQSASTQIKNNNRQIRNLSSQNEFAASTSFSNKFPKLFLGKPTESDIENYFFNNVWDFPSKPYLALPKAIFLRLTDKILSSYAEANIQENLFDIQKIFHRSIFDAFNESLSEYVFRLKRYSLFAEEVDILRKRQFDWNDLGFALAKSKYILIEKASEMVGFLLNKEDSTMDQLAQAMNPEALDMMQREKMTKMVIKDFFLDQDTQTLPVNLSSKLLEPELKNLENIILDNLVEDLIKEGFFRNQTSS